MRTRWRTREIVAPAAAAWDLLTLVEHWPEWGPSVADVDHDGERIGPGSTGRVMPVVGPSLPFEVTHFEDGRSWSWKVAGVPATGHLVEAIGTDRCRVGFSVPLVAAPYLVVCEVALRRIERALA